MRRKTRRAFAPYCWIVPKNILAVVLVVFTSVQLTNAQNPLRLAPITIDSTDIIGTCSNGAQVGGTVSHGPYQLSITPVACTGGQFKIDASSMLLRNGDLIEVNQVIGGATSADGTVVAGDAREDLEAEGYIGFAIDTFSSGEIQRYYNQTANAKPQERGVFGLDFGYRLVQGKPRWPFQLWLYGKTAHGVRSADVDCAKNPNFPTCLDAEKSLEDLGKNIPQNALYMLRNATSLEGSSDFVLKPGQSIKTAQVPPCSTSRRKPVSPMSREVTATLLISIIWQSVQRPSPALTNGATWKLATVERISS